jgi:hypothetical protein
MRQVHEGGDKLFVDYSGKKARIVDPATGEVSEVELFVAVLGASNFTYAEATLTQQIPDWIGSHVRALAALGGVPRAIVPDVRECSSPSRDWSSPSRRWSRPFAGDVAVARDDGAPAGDDGPRDRDNEPHDFRHVRHDSSHEPVDREHVAIDRPLLVTSDVMVVTTRVLGGHRRRVRPRSALR